MSAVIRRLEGHLTSLLACTLVLGSATLIFAGATQAAPGGPLYALADNLLLVSALLSLGPPLLRRPELEPALPAGHRLVPILAAAAPLLCIGATLARYGPASSADLAVAAVVGLAIGGAILELAAERWGVAAEPWPPARALRAALPLALAASLLLRAIAPGSAALLVAAGLSVAFLPGLGLGALLLPPGSTLKTRLLHAPALSLSAQLVTLLWLDHLGVPATAAIFVTVPVVFTLPGLLGFGRRLHEEGP